VNNILVTYVMEVAIPNFDAGVGLGVSYDFLFCMVSASPCYCEMYPINYLPIV